MSQLRALAIVGGLLAADVLVVPKLPGRGRVPGVRVPTTADTWYAPALLKLAKELGLPQLGSFHAIAAAHRVKLLEKWGPHADHPTLPNMRNNGDLASACQSWLSALPWRSLEVGTLEALPGANDLANSDNALWSDLQTVEARRDHHEQGYFRNVEATSAAIRETWSAIIALAVSLDTEGVLTDAHRREEGYGAGDGIADTAKALPGRTVDAVLGLVGGIAGALGPVLLGVAVVGGVLWWKS